MRGMIGTDVQFDALTLDNNVQADFETGAFSHKVLLGFDYQHIKTDTQSASRWGVSDFNLHTWNPDYDTGYELPPFTSDPTQTQSQTDLSRQAQTKTGRLTDSLGGRHDGA